jgi:hypothetical protein
MRKSRIERRNEWRLENRKTNGESNKPWISTVDPRYEPVVVKSKTYEANGKREVARRLKAPKVVLDYEIVGVSPMKAPSGEISALREKFS